MHCLPAAGAKKSQKKIKTPSRKFSEIPKNKNPPTISESSKSQKNKNPLRDPSFSDLKGIPRIYFFKDCEIWDLLVSSLQTCWKTFFWCLLTLRVNKNLISDGFGAISRQNHNGKWWISGENPLFWSILVSWNYSSPPHRKKITPWSKKYFFTENRWEMIYPASSPNLGSQLPRSAEIHRF